MLILELLHIARNRIVDTLSFVVEESLQCCTVIWMHTYARFLRGWRVQQLLTGTVGAKDTMVGLTGNKKRRQSVPSHDVQGVQ